MKRLELQPARDIDEVLAALDHIVEQSIATSSRLGYFAALYRKVTAKVKEGITRGFFDDAARMERLDVLFASRYLEALAAWQAGRPLTMSWRLAFRAAERWRPIVLQHLLLGINAHINLDLGIAAAETAPGAAITSLRADFERINEILFSLVESVADELAAISPWIGFLERAGGRASEEIIRFSLGIARDEAWAFAVDLAPVPPSQWTPLLDLRDRETQLVGETVLSPGWLLEGALFLIRCRESSDVTKNLRVLAGAPEPVLESVEARRLARGVRT